MTPERAAEIIVKGILGNKARVLVGIDAHAAAPPGQADRLALPGHRRQGVEEGRAAEGHRRLTLTRPNVLGQRGW